MLVSRWDRAMSSAPLVTPMLAAYSLPNAQSSINSTWRQGYSMNNALVKPLKLPIYPVWGGKFMP